MLLRLLTTWLRVALARVSLACWRVAGWLIKRQQARQPAAREPWEPFTTDVPGGPWVQWEGMVLAMALPSVDGWHWCVRSGALRWTAKANSRESAISHAQGAARRVEHTAIQ